MSATDSIMDNYWRAPPLTRNFTTLALGLSIAVHFKLLSGYWVVHVPDFLWTFPPQIWRPMTCFMITGSGLSMLFDTYFLYNYMSQMERGHPRFSRSGDLLWYLIFICSTILMIDFFVGFGFAVYLPALILAMTYTVTQDQRGMKANFYFITIPAQLTPFCMIAINLLFPGGVQSMLLQAEGLVAAHMYEFFTRIWPDFGGGRNILATPAWVSKLGSISHRLGRFGAAQPAGQASGSTTSSQGSGPLPDSWKTRGPGHRLG